MIAIFNTEIDAVNCAAEIHQYLLKNRLGYNATKWSNINKHEVEDKWYVKIPNEFKVTIISSKTVKEFIPMSSAKVYLSTWVKPELIKK